MTDRHRASLARKLVLEPHALGEVVQHARELTFALDRHLADRQVERERAAVASTPGHLAARPDDRGDARVEIPIEIAVVLVVIRRRHQHLDVATHHFGLGVAEQPLRAGIERFDVSLAVDDDDAVDRGIDDRSQPRIRVAEIRRTRVHLCFQALVRLAERVGSLALATGIAGDEPEDPGKESEGCHREGNRDELKTAHRRPVHLHAVGQQTVLFRAHRLQRAARAVHACALCLGIRWSDGTRSGPRRLDHRTKRGHHACRVLAKLRHPRLLIRIVACQRR